MHTWDCSVSPLQSDDAATLDHLVLAARVAVEEDARPQNAPAGEPLFVACLLSVADYAGTQVFGMGQMALHFGASESLHSVHTLGSTTNLSVLKLIAPEGHSNSHAPHWVHCEAMILKAMFQLLVQSRCLSTRVAKASTRKMLGV